MKLTVEEVNAALYAADPTRWPENFGNNYVRTKKIRGIGRTREEKLEFG